MTIILSEREWSELWEEFNFDSGLNTSDSFDIIKEYPKQLGTGFKRWIKLYSGFSLVIHDYELQDQLVLEVKPCKSDLEFVFNISGNLKLKDGQCVGPKQNYLLGSLWPGGTSQWLAGRILEVEIHVEPSILETLLGGQLESIPQELKRMIEGDEEQPYLQPQVTTTAMQQVLQQILNCPYQGLTKRIYLESKALEVLALRLEQILRKDSEPNLPLALRPDDLNRIYQAKDILIQNMDNPPSLLSLARQVGLNDYKLKIGFRHVFGTTAFGYLHTYRMEQARQLLETREMNVKEVANTVGFANSRYFSAAFKRQFGINPRSCLRGSLKNSV